MAHMDKQQTGNSYKQRQAISANIAKSLDTDDYVDPPTSVSTTSTTVGQPYGQMKGQPPPIPSGYSTNPAFQGGAFPPSSAYPSHYPQQQFAAPYPQMPSPPFRVTESEGDKSSLRTHIGAVWVAVFSAMLIILALIWLVGFTIMGDMRSTNAADPAFHEPAPAVTVVFDIGCIVVGFLGLFAAWKKKRSFATVFATGIILLIIYLIGHHIALAVQITDNIKQWMIEKTCTSQTLTTNSNQYDICKQFQADAIAAQWWWIFPFVLLSCMTFCACKFRRCLDYHKPMPQYQDEEMADNQLSARALAVPQDLSFIPPANFGVGQFSVMENNQRILRTAQSDPRRYGVLEPSAPLSQPPSYTNSAVSSASRKDSSMTAAAAATVAAADEDDIGRDIEDILMREHFDDPVRIPNGTKRTQPTASYNKPYTQPVQQTGHFSEVKY